MSKISKITLVLVLLCLVFFLESNAKKITIVALATEQKQAEFLQDYLQASFKKDVFVLSFFIPEKGDAIVLTINTQLEKEEFRLNSNEENGRVILNISSGSVAGLHYAVFRFLESLGFGFFLSFETVPENIKEIDLKGINISDKPLTSERIVFNWHNFLSGCSSWDFTEWKSYIDQSSKMRFNGLMTHFYANDPTFIFTHNEVEKVPGFMPNTQKGRQYGTQQVNDVRRLIGGEVFDDSVFGSNASKVTDENRVAEARKLMQKVHAYASSKYMNIWFGLDIDAELANPQEIMVTLPESAKMKVKQKSNKYFGTPDSVFYLPIPDSPEGFAYYKSQVSQLFQQFQEIDNIVLWTRTSGSPFLTLKYELFPHSWKKEFDQIAATNNKIDKNDINVSGRFATSKIYKTVRKCLDELGKNNVKLWAGSWRTTWLEQADWFYPKDVGFIPLDYHVDYFLVKEKHQILKTVAENREIIPVVWAHHDDGAFIGSPYIPYENLQKKVESVGNSGIGVIHWTTKPLDIYFKNLEQQIWSSTENAGLNHTTDYLSERMIVERNKRFFSEYLKKWVEEGPKFGRETRTWFIDHKITKGDYEKTIQSCKSRIAILEKINNKDNVHLQYFKGLEEFCIEFYKSQYNYQKALEALKSGNYDDAIQFVKKCQPENVIQRYADISKINGITKGEKGVIIEMNLSWLPMINSLRQSLGQQPTYINYGTVNFPDLGVGLLNTNYHMDTENRLWRNFGTAETGCDLVTTEADKLKSEIKFLKEIALEGLVVKESVKLDLKPFAIDISPRALRNPDYFVPGKYRVNLIFSVKESVHMEAEIQSLTKDEVLVEERIFALPGEICTKSFLINLKSKDGLIINLKNRIGTCFISGIIIEPVEP